MKRKISEKSLKWVKRYVIDCYMEKEGNCNEDCRLYGVCERFGEMLKELDGMISI